MKTSLLGRFYSLMLIPLLGVSSCDFIDDDEKTEPVRVAFPSVHKIYPDGAKNTYSVDVRFLPLSGDSDLTGKLTMDWGYNAQLNDPLDSGRPVTFVKFTTVEDIPGLVFSEVTQYIEQSALNELDEGSIFLHAIENGLADKYWIDTSTPSDFTNRERFQTLFSPFQTDIAAVGEKGEIRTFNYSVMGNCTAVRCDEIATVTGSFTVIDQPLQIIPTALGDFEAYRVDYNMTVVPVATITTSPLNSILDFRMSCAVVTGDFSQTVTVGGDMYINPDVGMVLITNTCNGTTINGNTTYIASLTNTTLSFETTP